MRVESRTLILTVAAGVLSGLWGCETLLPDLLPGLQADRRGSGSGSFSAEAMLLAIMFCGLGLHAAVKRVPWPQGREVWKLVAAGAGLFVLPPILVHLTDTESSAYTRTVLLTMVPVFSVVLEPYLGGQGNVPVRGGLLAAMAGTVGALLVFPVDVPSSGSAGLAMAATLIAAFSIAGSGCIVYRHGSVVRRASQALSPGLAVVAGTGALGLLGLDVCVGFGGGLGSFFARVRTEFGWSDFLELPALCLLLFLLPRLSPMRAAVRYLLAPVIAILLGVLLLRLSGNSPSPLELRTWIGLAVMAGSAGYLLLAPGAEPASASGLLGLG